MERKFIISEIQRTAENGKAVGQRRFSSETGIKPHEWQGKYWARWGDALLEAGFSQNEWQTAPDETHILESWLKVARNLGRFPTKYDILMARNRGEDIPGVKPVKNCFGTRAVFKEKLLEYCFSNHEYGDLVSLVRSMSVKEKAKTVSKNDDDGIAGPEVTAGYVYLVRAQSAYKIGSTRAPYRRASEIANQSANGAELLHLIATDDPEGIESYWHRRFGDKKIDGLNKQSGEWFKLTKEDTKVFRRRKTM